MHAQYILLIWAICCLPGCSPPPGANSSGSIPATDTLARYDNGQVFISRQRLNDSTEMRYYYCRSGQPYDSARYVHDSIVQGLCITGVFEGPETQWRFTAIGYYRHGLRTGVWHFYHTAREPDQKGYYNSGKKNGRWLGLVSNGRWAGLVFESYYRQDTLVREKELGDWRRVWEQQSQQWDKEHAGDEQPSLACFLAPD